MATQNGEKKGNFFKRVWKWIVRLCIKIGKAFYNMFHEMKKVTWPTKKGLVNYSLIVLAFMVVMGVIIGVFDLGVNELVRLIIG
ncbi:MAG: preprotein translocase subunit SecE [Clostridia bacterium]|nr:preprotein translocase subunit SecE [Clostridia bacterium]